MANLMTTGPPFPCDGILHLLLAGNVPPNVAGVRPAGNFRNPVLRIRGCIMRSVRVIRSLARLATTVQSPGCVKTRVGEGCQELFSLSRPHDGRCEHR